MRAVSGAAKRSELSGFAGYGYCASHSRYFWGLRLHLVTTPGGLPITFALSNPKLDEREVLRDLLEIEPELLDDHPGQVVLADKGYRSAELETFLADHGATLLRPAMRGEDQRPGARFLKPLRQVIESVNDTLKGQLDLERHGGRTKAGVVVRVLTPARPDRSHLAQRPCQCPAPPVAARLRPLTPWN